MGVAGLFAIAGFTVIAKGIIGRVDNRISLFIAGVLGTRNAIIHIGRIPLQTSFADIAGLFAIAVLPVVAYGIVRRMGNCIQVFIAGIDGAFDAVVGVWGVDWLTAFVGIA